jgi:hypothetical protein
LGAGSRQAVKQGEVGLRPRERCNLPVEHIDRRDTVRSCATSASTCNRQAVMMPGSSVRGVAARIDSRRAAIRLVRHLWAWKNASRVVLRARLTVKACKFVTVSATR